MPQVTSDILAGTPWTFWAARLTDRGNVVFDQSSGATAPTSATKTYTVVIPQTSDFALASVTGLPAMGSAYSAGYPTLVATKITPTCANATAGVWTIEVEYGNQTTTVVPPSQPGGEPTNYVYKAIQYGTSPTEGDALFDAGTGAPLRNMLGDTYDSVERITRYAPTVSITRLETTAPGVTSYSGTINNAAITICGLTFPKHCAMVHISGSVTNETVGNTVYKFLTTYTIVGQRNEYGRGSSVTVTVAGQTVDGTFYRQGSTLVDIGYDKPIMEAGFNVMSYHPKMEKVRAVITDPSGTKAEVVGAVPLNNNGSPAESSAQYVIREWQLIPDKDWTALKLPATVPEISPN